MNKNKTKQKSAYLQERNRLFMQFTVTTLHMFYNFICSTQWTNF